MQTCGRAGGRSEPGAVGLKARTLGPRELRQREEPPDLPTPWLWMLACGPGGRAPVVEPCVWPAAHFRPGTPIASFPCGAEGPRNTAQGVHHGETPRRQQTCSLGRRVVPWSCPWLLGVSCTSSGLPVALTGLSRGVLDSRCVRRHPVMPGVCFCQAPDHTAQDGEGGGRCHQGCPALAARSCPEGLGALLSTAPWPQGSEVEAGLCLSPLCPWTRPLLPVALLWAWLALGCRPASASAHQGPLGGEALCHMVLAGWQGGEDCLLPGGRASPRLSAPQSSEPSPGGQSPQRGC